MRYPFEVFFRRFVYLCYVRRQWARLTYFKKVAHSWSAEQTYLAVNIKLNSVLQLVDFILFNRGHLSSMVWKTKMATELF